MYGSTRSDRRRSARALGAAASASAAIFALAACGGTASSDTTGPSITPTAAINAEAQTHLPDDIRQRGTLRLTADFLYPPFTFMEGGERAGMDYELGNEIARRLGLKAEWTTQSSFDAIVPSVQNGRFDAAMDSINANPERLEAVSFVTYVRTYSVLVTPKGNPDDLDPENLCGATLSVGTASADLPLEQAYSEECVRQGLDPITLNQFATTSDQMLSVTSGRSEGVAQGSAPAAFMIQRAGDTYESLGAIRQLDGELMRSAEAGVAYAKSNTGLGQALRLVIAEMQADGSYDEIFAKWGLDDQSKVPAAVVE